MQNGHRCGEHNANDKAWPCTGVRVRFQTKTHGCLGHVAFQRLTHTVHLPVQLRSASRTLFRWTVLLAFQVSCYYTNLYPARPKSGSNQNQTLYGTILTFAVGLKLTFHKELVVSPTPQYEESSGYTIPFLCKKRCRNTCPILICSTMSVFPPGAGHRLR